MCRFTNKSYKPLQHGIYLIYCKQYPNFLRPAGLFGRKNDQEKDENSVAKPHAQPDFYNYETLVILSVSQLYFVPAF